MPSTFFKVLKAAPLLAAAAFRMQMRDFSLGSLEQMRNIWFSI